MEKYEYTIFVRHTCRRVSVVIVLLTYLTMVVMDALPHVHDFTIPDTRAGIPTSHVQVSTVQGSDTDPCLLCAWHLASTTTAPSLPDFCLPLFTTASAQGHTAQRFAPVRLPINPRAPPVCA